LLGFLLATGLRFFLATGLRFFLILVHQYCRNTGVGRSAIVRVTKIYGSALTHPRRALPLLSRWSVAACGWCTGSCDRRPPSGFAGLPT
jgi:hypothetical protein